MLATLSWDNLKQLKRTTTKQAGTKQKQPIDLCLIMFSPRIYLAISSQGRQRSLLEHLMQA